MNPPGVAVHAQADEVAFGVPAIGYVCGFVGATAGVLHYFDFRFGSFGMVSLALPNRPRSFIVASAIIMLVCDGLPFAGWDIGLAPGEVASIGLATGTVGISLTE